MTKSGAHSLVTADEDIEEGLHMLLCESYGWWSRGRRFESCLQPFTFDYIETHIPDSLILSVDVCSAIFCLDPIIRLSRWLSNDLTIVEISETGFLR